MVFRLTQDMVSEKYPDVHFSSLRTLDLLQCGLKSVDLTPVGAFDNLARLASLHLSFLCLKTDILFLSTALTWRTTLSPHSLDWFTSTNSRFVHTIIVL